jgi:hypothetical protein
MKTSKIILFGLAICALSGCGYPHYESDNQEKQAFFFKCLQELPAGPETTKYNDWNEIVSECAQQAAWMTQKCVKNCD